MTPRDRLLYASLFHKTIWPCTQIEGRIGVIFRPRWKLVRPNPSEKGNFSLFQDENSKYSRYSGLKLAHKEYQKINFLFSVKKEEESVFLGRKQTKMEIHRSAHLGVRH